MSSVAVAALHRFFATKSFGHCCSSLILPKAEEPAFMSNYCGLMCLALFPGIWSDQKPVGHRLNSLGYVHAFPALIPILIFRIFKNFKAQLKEVYCPVIEKGGWEGEVYRKQSSERQPLSARIISKLAELQVQLQVELQVQFLFLAPLSGLDCGFKKIYLFIL